MTLGDWRDVSIILLAFEAMVIGLVYGAVFYYLWKGFRVAHGWLQKIGLPQGQRYARLARQYTYYYSHKTVKPVVELETKLGEVAETTRTLLAPPRDKSKRS